MNYLMDIDGRIEESFHIVYRKEAVHKPARVRPSIKTNHKKGNSRSRKERDRYDGHSS